KHMITGGDLRQSRLDIGYKTFTISPCEKPFVQSDGHGRLNHRTCKKIGLIHFGQSIKTAVAVKKSGKKRA
ncbi:hypothetical protein, partial [Raoultella ornithinolytica]|uniref:hypothetical protein n=1 Tax=Raoultella ornithinolytica TaxID=54291 RepID=UPI0021BBA079